MFPESTPNSVVATLGSSSSLEDMDLGESLCAGMPYKNESQTSGIKLANGKKGRSHASKNCIIHFYQISNVRLVTCISTQYLLSSITFYYD